jgi:hypothetical protein
MQLPVPWALALHSDGLFEGYTDEQPDTSTGTDNSTDTGNPAESRPRLGLSGLLDILATAQARDLDDSTLLDTVITEAERRNGGPMADDLALLLVRHDPVPGA